MVTCRKLKSEKCVITPANPPPPIYLVNFLKLTSNALYRRLAGVPPFNRFFYSKNALRDRILNTAHLHDAPKMKKKLTSELCIFRNTVMNQKSLASDTLLNQVYI